MKSTNLCSILCGILSLFFSTSQSTAADISLASSKSPSPAISVRYSNVAIVGNTLTARVQIYNISGTWVWIAQNISSPIGPATPLNPNIFLLGPSGVKVFDNVSFQVGSYLQFDTTTPIGVPFNVSDPKCRALFGVLTIDLMMRGLLTTPLPPDAFDGGSLDPAVDALFDELLSASRYFGALYVDLKKGDYVQAASDLGQILAEVDEFKDILT